MDKNFISSLKGFDLGLKEIREYAQNNHIPILKHESAVFLKQLIMLKNPTKILEVGTGIGYSGSIILSSCDGSLVSTEHNEKSLKLANENFARFGFGGRVTAILGDESEIIPLLNQKFDFIFLDGAKTRYVQHLPYLKRMLNEGGILLADNVMFGGRVTGENTQIGSKMSIVTALRCFLTELHNDADFVTSLIDIGDGMTLSIKSTQST